LENFLKILIGRRAMGRKTALNGICEICKAPVTKRGVKEHLQAHFEEGGKKGNAAGGQKRTGKLFHLTVEGYGLSGDLYWMHLKALGSARLRDLDTFLRDIWLECCGHMSVFSDREGDFEMGIKLKDILRPGLKLNYEYDFGSITELLLTVISEFEGTPKKGKVEILVRNEAPRIKCDQCENPATTICTECLYDGEGWLCDDCAGTHGCDEEMFLPLVNSPRAGVCGYTG
jgi:hypothetical protein